MFGLKRKKAVGTEIVPFPQKEGGVVPWPVPPFRVQLSAPELPKGKIPMFERTYGGTRDFLCKLTDSNLIISSEAIIQYVHCMCHYEKIPLYDLGEVEHYLREFAAHVRGQRTALVRGDETELAWEWTSLSRLNKNFTDPDYAILKGDNVGNGRYLHQSFSERPVLKRTAERIEILRKGLEPFHRKLNFGISRISAQSKAPRFVIMLTGYEDAWRFRKNEGPFIFDVIQPEENWLESIT